MKKLLFIAILISGLISAKAADIKFRNKIPDYHPLELVFMSSVKTNKKIPQNKYVRLIISYSLNKKLKKISLVLNGPHSINFLYFSITKIKGVKPRLYIIGLKRNPEYNSNFVVFKHCKILSNKECNALLLDYNPNLSLNIGEETVLGRTYKANPPTQGSRDIGFYPTEKSNRKLLPRIEFKIKAELDDSPDIFLLKRDLSVTLGKMTLKQQRNWLNKELDRRAEMNKKGEAAIGDLTTVMKYRIEVEKKLGLR